MIKRFLILNILIILIMPVLLSPAQAKKKINKKTFNVTIPKLVQVNAIGISEYKQYFGLPKKNEEVQFNLRLDKNITSETESWEITTNKPIGMSVTYNSRGNIMAVFVSMKRIKDGVEIPPSDIRIYPSKVVFDIGPGPGNIERIFHFNPIIRVSKKTPPGDYEGTITFTVLSE